MEEVQTGTIINSYEQPRSRRLKDNISSSEESENEDDSGMSGFYIREKTDKSKVKKDAEVNSKKEDDVISHLNSNAEITGKEQSEVKECPDTVISNEEKDEDKMEEESTVGGKDEHETIVSERNTSPNIIESNGQKEMSGLNEEEQACESKNAEDNIDKNCKDVKIVEEVDETIERDNVEGDEGQAVEVPEKNCTADDSLLDGETEAQQRSSNECENQNQSHCDVDSVDKTENGGSEIERENTNDKTVDKTNDSLSNEEIPDSNMQEETSKEEEKLEKSVEEDKLEKNVEVDKLEKSEEEDKLDKSEEEVKLDKSEKENKLDKSEENVKLDKSEEETKLDKNEEEVKLDKSEEENKLDKSEEEVKLDKSEEENKLGRSEDEVKLDKSEEENKLNKSKEDQLDQSETSNKQNEESTDKKENIDTSETETANKQNEEQTDKTENNTDKLATEAVNKQNEEPTGKPENNSDKSATEQNTKDDKSEDNAGKLSFLKEQLLLPKNQEDSSQPTFENNGSAEGDQEMDMEDFDPSLLCPDISMDVDDQPVIPPNETPTDGSSSPLPYEPVFSTYVDEMTATEVTFDLTPAECELRSRMYGKDNPVQYSKIHCSACNIHLGSALDGQKNRFVHPLLKVLICKNCYHFYTSGEFEKDEDGSELYCRWCGQGGQVLCCSACEFVFCKRCIRNNFGLKKFKDIKNSDDWLCFRCDPSQIASLRATCAELMDYIRTEMAKASAVINDSPDFMTKDYTTCCQKPEKKEPAPTPKEPSKRKKRKVSNDDPDYNPLKDLEEDEQKRPAIPPVTVAPIPILPKIAVRASVPVVTTAPGQAIRVVAPGVRPAGLGYTVTRPAAAQGSVRSTGPGYIKIMPPKPAQTTSSFTPMRQPMRANTSQPQRMPLFQQKHEWFEKTVRAAARVNSNLSYTLTQLNRQQATANSVEALAVVHNKLQEVLSTSINSLIQIRKNLRTEFIAGIKAIKVPSRPTPAVTTASTSRTPQAKDDDDVIFVSNAPAPKPAAVVSVPKPTVASKPGGVSKVAMNDATNNVVRSLPPGISIVKRIAPKPTEIAPKPTQTATTLTEIAPKPKETAPKPKETAPDLYSNPTPSTSFSSPNATKTNNGEKKGGYIKVKSFSALQSVPPECITIPDDPPPLTPMKNFEPENRIVSEDPPSLTPVKLVEETQPGKRKRSPSPDLSVSKEEKENTEGKNLKVQIIEKESQLNGSNEDSNTSKIEDKNILNCKIVLRRSKEIDQLVKKKCDVVNGD